MSFSSARISEYYRAKMSLSSFVSSFSLLLLWPQISRWLYACSFCWHEFYHENFLLIYNVLLSKFVCILWMSRHWCRNPIGWKYGLQRGVIINYFLALKDMQLAEFLIFINWVMTEVKNLCGQFGRFQWQNFCTITVADFKSKIFVQL